MNPRNERLDRMLNRIRKPNFFRVGFLGVILLLISSLDFLYRYLIKNAELTDIGKMSMLLFTVFFVVCALDFAEIWDDTRYMRTCIDLLQEERKGEIIYTKYLKTYYGNQLGCKRQRPVRYER